MFTKFQKGKKFRYFFTFLTFFTFFTFLTFVSYAGISTTKHNLSISGPGIKATDVNQTCVFCHTPHSASKAVDGAPLWNHSISSATYSVLGPPLPTESRLTTPGQPDGSSKLCLGCHDGTVALGLLINVPGSGTGGTVAGLESFMPCGPGDYSCLGTNFVSGGKHLDSFGWGDHMISMEYNSALVTNKLVKCADGYASLALASIPLPAGPVQLYKTRHVYPSGGPDADVKGVQCRSCHDPHVDDSPYKCFLVHVSGIQCTGGSGGCCTTNVGDDYSALCTTCHINCP